jgi:hypothetical protein
MVRRLEGGARGVHVARPDTLGIEGGALCARFGRGRAQAAGGGAWVVGRAAFMLPIAAPANAPTLERRPSHKGVARLPNLNQRLFR